MKNDRRLWLKALAALPVAAALPARADGMAEIRQRGRLRFAVYNDFSPYSTAGGKGIDADIARALATRLGLAADVVGYNAGEEMSDDLRNMVWKGHYLGTQPSDVMLHVPVDEYLAKANDKVRILAPYHRESLAMARLPERVPKAPVGSAAVALEVFTREKIGVEGRSLADSFLLGVMNGRLRDNVVHFKSTHDAVTAMVQGQLAAVLGPRAEVEDAVRGRPGPLVEAAAFPELKVDGWALGIAVKAGDGELALALDKAMSDLKRDGTIAGIFRQHGISHQAV